MREIFNSFIFIFFISNVQAQAVRQLDFTEAAERTVHSVVHIKTEFERKSSVYDDFFGFSDPFLDFFGLRSPSKSYPIVATGSGVIISEDGYIVTNNHVVQDAAVISITLNDKREFLGEIVGTDPSTDLALVKIEANNLPNINFANSDDVKIGEWVLAVGNPFNLTSTVTAGIVSAKARNLNILGKNSNIDTFIQTDAAVNQGNSGGALVNTKGELIGINAAIASNTGSYTGYSFAMPSNIVKKVSEDLISCGIVQQAFLGASFSEINGKLANELQLDEIKGIYIIYIDPRGGAYEAGIETGGILLSIDKHEINSFAELKEILNQHRPGDEVVLKIKEGKRIKSYKVELKNMYGNIETIKKAQSDAVSSLGASFSEVSQQTKQSLRIKNGIQVSKLSDGLLKDAGIKEGFIIISINKTEIYKTEQIDEILKYKNSTLNIIGIYPNGMKVYYTIGV